MINQPVIGAEPQVDTVGYKKGKPNKFSNYNNFVDTAFSSNPQEEAQAIEEESQFGNQGKCKYGMIPHSSGRHIPGF